MAEAYRHYLIDESHMMGSAESISFPESEFAMRRILQVLQETKTPITIQGG
jgi:hypothetical protein